MDRTASDALPRALSPAVRRARGNFKYVWLDLAVASCEGAEPLSIQFAGEPICCANAVELQVTLIGWAAKQAAKIRARDCDEDALLMG
jgi:hypothetical protein